MRFWNLIFRAKPRSLALCEIEADQDLYVYHHLGLGDMIHCNGLVRYLLTQLPSERSVHVFCKDRNAEMTRWMYRDEPRIVVLPLLESQRELPQVEAILRTRHATNFLSVGHRALRPLLSTHPHAFFDELFYQQIGLPYALRYTHCYWSRELDQEERVFEKLAPNQPYAFVHDDTRRGYRIDTDSMTLPVVRNDITESIFHLGLLLERATEVHCMESSIRCMIESLDMSRVRLVYHNFRYPDRPLGHATRQSWVQIDRTLAAA